MSNLGEQFSMTNSGVAFYGFCKILSSCMMLHFLNNRYYPLKVQENCQLKVTRYSESFDGFSLCHKTGPILLSDSTENLISTEYPSKLNPLAGFSPTNDIELNLNVESTSSSPVRYDSDLIFNFLPISSPTIINGVYTPIISETSDVSFSDLTNNLSDNSLEYLGNAQSICARNTGTNVATNPLNPNAKIIFPLGIENVSTTDFSDTVSDDQNSSDPKSILRQLKDKNSERPVIGQLNINFIAPKFEPLVSLIKDNIDLLMVSETKVDESYPNGQFEIEGYSKPIRLDRNCHGGGFMIFPREDLPCHELKSHELPSDIECKFLELRIRQSKWLVVAGYNPHKEKISYFLRNVGKELDKYLTNYENLLMLGDWNSSVTEKAMTEFCEMYNLENLIREPTCYKSAENPSSIDIISFEKREEKINSWG